jgi:hypothetical protein
VVSYLWVREELDEAASLFLEATAAKGCHSVKRFGVVDLLWLASPEKT